VNYYISFATRNWKNSQQKAEEQAYLYGADKVISYGPKDLSQDFVQKNSKILSNTRGAGYWLWKPFVILKTLNSIQYGDKIIYADSGAYAIDDLDKIFSLVDYRSMALFQLSDQINAKWVSKECCEYMKCTSNEFLNSKQACATFQVYKKTNETIGFVEEYLESCSVAKVIMDSDNGYDNRYVEHRHDQSILSCIAFKRKIEMFRDPSQWGNGVFLQNSSYGQIFKHHRGMDK